MEYPAGFVFYTMGKAGFLQGLAEDVDLARSRGMAVATRNVGDFSDIGIEVIDPWTGA